jgi:uncharacterized OB-fold protein
MRSVVRIASYVPVGSSGSVRVGASDEDAFTLGVTAVERVWGDTDRPSEPVSVHLLGEYPPMADWGFPAILGREAKVVRHPGDAEELARTLRMLEEGEGGPGLVVAAELPERVTRPDGYASSPVGAAAVAYLLEASGETRPFPLKKADPRRSAVATTLQRGKAGGRGAQAVAYVGDWDTIPAANRPLDLERVRRAAERDASAVSEGAYVPRARYLENLPSRWRFVADECGTCHEVTFPARGVCRRCRRRDNLTPVALARDGGRVVAITTIGQGGQPTEFDAQVESSGPYQVALVEIASGIRLTLQMTDASPGEVGVGDTVNTLLRRLYPMEGEWRYGRKAVPLPHGTEGRRER